ncbi:PREDICTED: AP-5 complex subunit zeta-1 isoform X2 [Capra hircus]|uniref:AP-5 complex subunit zeta-1 isoform X2 n=1 Tax=Capra hircus TaxID=9925 RepID=UPI0008478102|nr:PREDICTED: AP-5 complex subunit zeta-1 isoform X2 [Capra hircus]
MPPGASSPHPEPGSRALSLRWTGPWPQTSSRCCPRASTSRRTSGSTCRPSLCCGPGCCRAAPSAWVPRMQTTGQSWRAPPCQCSRPPPPPATCCRPPSGCGKKPWSIASASWSRAAGVSPAPAPPAPHRVRLGSPRVWAPWPPFEFPEHGLLPHPEVPVGRRDQVALFPPPGALRKADSDLQKACLVEAVLVLDVLCRQDPSFLYRALPSLRALRTRLCGDPACARVLLPVAQFFLHHGEAAAVDADAVCQHLFTRIPSEHFHSPMLGFEFVQFCRDHLLLFGSNLDLLRTSFPNLFKFLAWSSPALTSEFVALLPALVDAGTAVEMLHLLLDLPSLTAALELQLRSLQAASERPLWDASVRAPGCLEALRDPQAQGLFQHLLRAKASGTVERLTPLHQLLQPLASCARVLQCAQAVPTLLRAFFAAVTQFADGALASQLALLLLERSDSLFPVEGYEADVHRVLSSQFPGLCRLHPPLVVERAKELLEFVGSLGGPRSTGHMLTSVVWAIGEYLSVSWDRRCTAEQINRFFEVLEALLFEVTQSRPSATLPKCPPQVITVLMTTLTKLASRSQDLIPRVSLLLSKMRTLAQSPAVGPVHSEDDLGAVRTRATELLNLLKMPSVAQFVLTPSMEVSQPRYHRDCNTALPLALDMVSRLLEREAGLLPG